MSNFIFSESKYEFCTSRALNPSDYEGPRTTTELTMMFSNGNAQTQGAATSCVEMNYVVAHVDSDGKVHREDLPAMSIYRIYVDSHGVVIGGDLRTEIYALNGFFHRDHGPAVIDYSKASWGDESDDLIVKTWCQHGSVQRAGNHPNVVASSKYCYCNAFCVGKQTEPLTLNHYSDTSKLIMSDFTNLRVKKHNISGAAEIIYVKGYDKPRYSFYYNGNNITSEVEEALEQSGIVYNEQVDPCIDMIIAMVGANTNG